MEPHFDPAGDLTKASGADHQKLLDQLVLANEKIEELSERLEKALEEIAELKERDQYFYEERRAHELLQKHLAERERQHQESYKKLNQRATALITRIAEVSTRLNNGKPMPQKQRLIVSAQVSPTSPTPAEVPSPPTEPVGLQEAPITQTQEPAPLPTDQEQIPATEGQEQPLFTQTEQVLVDESSQQEANLSHQ